MRYCLASRCPEMVEGRDTYCPAHRPVAKPWASKREREISGWAWGRICTRVRSRDRHRCVICGRPAKQVDHIIPVADGGTNDLPNLRLLCDDHHAAKSKAEAAAGRARRALQ